MWPPCIFTREQVLTMWIYFPGGGGTPQKIGYLPYPYPYPIYDQNLRFFLP